MVGGADGVPLPVGLEPPSNRPLKVRTVPCGKCGRDWCCADGGMRLPLA